MIKTISAMCPKCKNFNAFNVLNHVNKLTEINVPWFQCSFCFQISHKEFWESKKPPGDM